MRQSQNVSELIEQICPYSTLQNIHKCFNPCVFPDISWPTHIQKQEFEQMIFISTSSIVNKVITMLVIQIILIYRYSLAPHFTQKENVCKSVWMDSSLSATGDTKL